MAQKYLCVGGGILLPGTGTHGLLAFLSSNLENTAFQFPSFYFFSFGYKKNNVCSSSHSVVSLSLMPWSNFVALYWPPFLKREAFWTLIQISLFFSHSTHLQRPRFAVFLDCGFFPPLMLLLPKERKEGKKKVRKKEKRKKWRKERRKRKGEGEIERYRQHFSVTDFPLYSIQQRPYSVLYFSTDLRFKYEYRNRISWKDSI